MKKLHLTERQKFWLAIACIPLLPVAGVVVLASAPLVLFYCVAREVLDVFVFTTESEDDQQ